MRIPKYEQFINETLKSDDIDIVIKKITNLLSKYGLSNKNIGTGNTKIPSFTITSDRYFLKRSMDEYVDGTSSLVKAMAKKGYSSESMIKHYQKLLDGHKKGDIFISINKNNPAIGKDLLKVINSIGYFVASAGSFEDKIKDKNKIDDYIINSKEIFISIEPNFDDKVDFDGEYLYHATDRRNLDKIFKSGLIPKSKNTRSFYPERIYLSPNIEYMKAIGTQLSSDKGGDYVFLKIKNTGLSLYKDVRFSGGFYTYDNISPKNIEIIEV